MQNNNGLFETKCAECGKKMYTYATSRMGTLKTVYCGTVCETNAKYKRRFK